MGREGRWQAWDTGHRVTSPGSLFPVTAQGLFRVRQCGHEVLNVLTVQAPGHAAERSPRGSGGLVFAPAAEAPALPLGLCTVQVLAPFRLIPGN